MNRKDDTSRHVRVSHLLMSCCWFCCIDYADENRSVNEFRPKGLLLINYATPHSRKYTKFKQEMSDIYLEKYGRRPRAIPDVRCFTDYACYVASSVTVQLCYTLSAYLYYRGGLRTPPMSCAPTNKWSPVSHKPSFPQFSSRHSPLLPRTFFHDVVFIYK